MLRTPPEDPDADSRLDLASHRVVTIDDAGTREIDDGLSVERGADGGVRLWVHIADPSRWVAPGDELDAHARFATRTLYQPTGAPLSALGLWQLPATGSEARLPGQLSHTQPCTPSKTAFLAEPSSVR